MLKYLPELIGEQVISQEVADRITDYYQQKKEQGQNKLFILFAVLGALLVGLGIILLIAHNWDSLSVTVKLVLSFVPLVVAQTLCGFTLVKKPDNRIWSESSATFLFCSVGASISLVSQIYHIEGDLGLFILMWMCLCLPVIYLMRSSFVSLLYLVGITCYACIKGYGMYPASEPYWYWLLLILAVPYYIGLVKKRADSHFVRFHYLAFAVSVTVVLGTLSKGNANLMYIAYFSLFGSFLLLGELPFYQRYQLQDKFFELIGFAGTMVLLFMLSFDWFWNKIIESYPKIIGQEMIAVIGLTLLAGLLLYRKYPLRSLSAKQSKGAGVPIRSVDVVFGLFIPIYLCGGAIPSLGMICINCILLFLGVSTILKGFKNNQIGTLNLGLLVLAVLIACRFFDTNLSFVTRGLLFVAAGLGFFVLNYRMLKKRKDETSHERISHKSE